MNAYHSLKKTSDFLHVYHHGKHRRNQYFVFFKIGNECGYNRYGVSAGKKVGNSVVRHRINRISREAFRRFDEQVNDGTFDFVLSWRDYDPSLKSGDVLDMVGKLNEKCSH